MLVAQTLIGLLGLYGMVGLVFAPFFVLAGAARLDPSVKHSSRGFCLLIVPGVIVFWPLLAWRWWQGVQQPPTERNAHRTAVQKQNG